MKFPSWLRNPIGRRTKSRKRSLSRSKSRWSRLFLEPLEERVLLANIFWNVDASGSWDVAGNNQGQADANVAYLARGPDIDLSLLRDGAVFALGQSLSTPTSPRGVAGQLPAGPAPVRMSWE